MQDGEIFFFLEVGVNAAICHVKHAVVFEDEAVIDGPWGLANGLPVAAGMIGIRKRAVSVPGDDDPVVFSFPEEVVAGFEGFRIASFGCQVLFYGDGVSLEFSESAVEVEFSGGGVHVQCFEHCGPPCVGCALLVG